MSGLSIVRAGLFTTVQDLGRWGFQSRGVPVSGAMDRYSHRLANRLVGNPDSAATIEVTLMGPQIAFDTDAVFAVTGAVFEMTLNGTMVEMNRATQAGAGSILKFGERRGGARSYVAIAGGVDVPEVLGSRATHALSGMGGHDGRALRSGDRLATGPAYIQKMVSDTFFREKRCLTPFSLPVGGARLRVIPAEQGIFARLVSQRLTVSPRSDRMGYRLDGAVIGEVPTGELISRAVATGAVQIPPTGQPILLMADRATTGGYIVAATVITADLPVAAQLVPGDWVEFEPCSMESADQALRDQETALGGE